MRIGRKNWILGILLGTFVFLRLGNVHILSHGEEDSTVHCELCELITVSQQVTPFLPDASIEFEPEIAPPYVAKQESNFGYEAPLFSIVSPPYIYNKPPPLG